MNSLVVDLIEEIKSQISVRDVLVEHGVEITSDMFRCIYPKHLDEHPSSSVYENDRRFYCHVCGRGGDVIDAYAILNGLHNSQAIDSDE